MHKFAIALAIPFLTLSMLAQAAPAVQETQAPVAPVQDNRGPLAYIDFGGSVNSNRQIYTLGLSAGYQFSRHLSVSARLPVYFVTATTTSSSTGQQTTLTNNGVGDPTIGLNLGFSKRAWLYQTSVDTSIPVTSTSNGFSTGNVLVDWTTRVSRRIGRLVPFGRLDLGNTVPDTPVFILPYTAEGFNTRLEGGANLVLTKALSAGASAYDVIPSGQQSVYSRMVTTSNSGMLGGSGGGMMGGTSGGMNGFMTAPLTVGNDLTRDHGASVWLSATVHNYIDMQVAYTRSYGYDLNTVTFGMGYNLGEALRHRRQRQ